MGKPYAIAVPTPLPASRPRLGRLVKATHRMVRRHALYPGREVWWAAEPCKEPIVGIYIGYRLKQNGEHYLGSYDEAGYLRRTSTVSVALVQVSERARPVAVSWQGLEVIGAV